MLPLLMALAAALISGILGFFKSAPQKEVIVQMTLIMVIFYVIGLFVRSTLICTIEQIEKKKKEREEEEEKKKQQEKAKNEEQKMLGVNIDMTADDNSFDPLPVSEFIKKELKNDN
jgi:phosphotransferase system  glucose/maltose/N-acetylglucosamine-specific IIC component